MSAASVAVAPARRRSPPLRAAVALAGVAAVGAAAAAAGVGGEEAVNPGGAALAGRFLEAAVHPRVDPGFLALTAEAAATTAAYALLGTLVAVAIGLAGATVLSEAWWLDGTRSRRRTAAWLVARAGATLPRGVHEVVWGLALLAVLGLDPLVAVLAIGLPYGAITAKVYAEILDETPQAPFRALRAAGASRPAALLYGLLPAARPHLVGYGFYRLECAMRAAAVLGLVGAGGLGFELALSFEALRYEEMWTLLYALIALCAAVEVWSALVRRARARRRLVPAGSALAIAAAVPPAVWLIELRPAALWDGGTLRLAGDLVAQAWPPAIGADALGRLPALAVDTLAMSVLAMALAVAGGLALGLLAADLRAHGTARRRPARAAGLAARAALLVLRAVPAPVWAFVLLLVLFPGVLPGALALGVYNAGVLGRLSAEAVEQTDRRPADALSAAGAGRAQAVLVGLLPGALSRLTAYAMYRWEVAIRETIVVGVVGAGGLGLLLREQLAAFDHPAALVTVGALLALTALVDLASAGVRRALR